MEKESKAMTFSHTQQHIVECYVMTTCPSAATAAELYNKLLYKCIILFGLLFILVFIIEKRTQATWRAPRYYYD